MHFARVELGSAIGFENGGAHAGARGLMAVVLMHTWAFLCGTSPPITSGKSAVSLRKCGPSPRASSRNGNVRLCPPWPWRACCGDLPAPRKWEPIPSHRHGSPRTKRGEATGSGARACVHRCARGDCGHRRPVSECGSLKRFDCASHPPDSANGCLQACSCSDRFRCAVGSLTATLGGPLYSPGTLPTSSCRARRRSRLWSN